MQFLYCNMLFTFLNKMTPNQFSAVQMYNASNTSARVGKALEEVFKQYNKASEHEKVGVN